MTGAVSITCMIQIPIRYQAAGALSPLQAGIRLIPFSVFSPIGVIVVAALSRKRFVPPLYLAFVGEILQIIGLVFLSRSPLDNLGWGGLYGLEVLIGLGMGFCIGTATLMTPFIVEKRDLGMLYTYRGPKNIDERYTINCYFLAIGTGAVVQFRFLGSTVVLSIITAVGNNWVKQILSAYLTGTELLMIFRSTETIATLPSSVEPTVRRTFAGSFNLQMEIVLGFAVVAVFTSFMMWQKPQVRVP